ncbi:MAG: aldehyde ferredoxin oxidoreductase family protein [Candidatus Bathyarchaeia archaeon]
MPFGYNGKILRVDLSEDRIWTEEQDDNFYRRYLGGWALIAHYLLRELEPGTDPLGPKNKLIYAPGVVTGAPLGGSGRNAIGAKSPLTGAFAEADVGGFCGAELKRAGFDAVIVDGRAESPVYLWVHDGGAEIRDARRLWGMDIGDSQEMIREEVGEGLARTAQIGPGGEGLVRYACVINDLKHSAGRTGLGAVMGSKNLKAIAVRGRGRVEMAEPERVRELASWMRENVMAKAKRLHLYGTGAWMTAHVLAGNLPTRNFRDGEFPNPEAISAQTIEETVRIRMESCYACPVGCKKVVKIDEPWKVDPVYGGPEYETLAALGSDCGIDDLKALCKANELCQRYTLDTISTGAVIAFAMECFENGLITKEDTGGVRLAFGDVEAMLEMVELIGRREGFGNLLAEGVMRAAEEIGGGAERFAVHVKGQEVPMHDPRLKRALGLGYAVSPTGADHCHNIHDTGYVTPAAWSGIRAMGILEPMAVEDFGPRKVRLLIYHSNWMVLNNCMGMCQFLPWSYGQKVEIVRAVTGWNTTMWELLKVAERAVAMARAFNVREGLSVKDDWLPDRFFHPQTSGPISHIAVDPEELERAKHTYYGMVGWDEETGVPTRWKLEELGIGWVADELEGR